VKNCTYVQVNKYLLLENSVPVHLEYFIESGNKKYLMFKKQKKQSHLI